MGGDAISLAVCLANLETYNSGVMVVLLYKSRAEQTTKKGIVRIYETRKMKQSRMATTSG